MFCVLTDVLKISSADAGQWKQRAVLKQKTSGDEGRVEESGLRDYYQDLWHRTISSCGSQLIISGLQMAWPPSLSAHPLHLVFLIVHSDWCVVTKSFSSERNGLVAFVSSINVHVIFHTNPVWDWLVFFWWNAMQVGESIDSAIIRSRLSLCL